MPIARCNDHQPGRSKILNVPVQDGDYGVAVLDGKGAAWAEVVLQVYYDKGGFFHLCSCYLHT